MGPTKCVFPKPTTSNSFLLPWSLPNPTPLRSLSLARSQLEGDNAEARGGGWGRGGRGKGNRISPWRRIPAIARRRTRVSRSPPFPGASSTR
ncbi:hypothetical protein GW17_00002411 [Ensete ventricosum]|nr:hypothetical protein GW17_00002411 [Ensete ventricosum]